jgi:hypothetical protein
MTKTKSGALEFIGALIALCLVAGFAAWALSYAPPDAGWGSLVIGFVIFFILGLFVIGIPAAYCMAGTLFALGAVFWLLDAGIARVRAIRGRQGHWLLGQY